MLGIYMSHSKLNLQLIKFTFLSMCAYILICICVLNWCLEIRIYMFIVRICVFFEK